ncbi:MAG TPA: hypothetical protein VMW62_08685 [Chloroflexota bacterium]|nr:hypothetical protein [Chloroflexota bacterium]
MYWLIVGGIAGVFAYRYFREQGGEIPGFESLAESGRRLTERGQEFAGSGRQFVESGRQLAEEGKQFAQTAGDTAQARGREVVDRVKSMKVDVQEEPAKQSGG